MTINTQNVKAFRIHAEDIPLLLSGSVTCVPMAPPDAQVVKYADQWETGAAIVILSHPSFPEVPEGEVIPIVTVMVRHLVEETI